jgi:hypothetical protein
VVASGLRLGNIWPEATPVAPYFLSVVYKCGDVILIRLLSYLLMDVVVEFYIGTLPLLFRFVSVFENVV